MMAMRTLIVLSCVVAAAIAGGEKYSDKYDNINVKEILENKRLLVAYVDCMMDRGKCTPEGKELKEHMQEGLETGCDKCTDAQKEGTYTVIEYLIKNEPEIWKELCEKFDPTGKWRKHYEGRAKERGIEIPADK